MKLKRSRGRRRGRIEIIPMIDVMFFLLATFMLASL
jgi:biopolymer transport protein ExbD